MDDGNMVVARIPNPNAGPPGLTTASEVATMDFLRNVLEVPVPKVLAWSSTTDPENRVEAEYIIMEHAPGKNLACVWTDMKLEQKIQTMKDIVSVQQKLLSVQFSEYGCLFYSENAPPGSHPAEITAENLSPELVKGIPQRFSIGPVVDTAFWNKERFEMDIDRGPWRTAVDYIVALALQEIAWIRKYAIPRSLDDPLYVSDSQNTPMDHIALLRKYLAVAPHLLPQEGGILGSFLWHTDLRLPNIFVDDNGNITNIIDWQGVWAGPLVLEGRHPQFLNYNCEITLKLPDDFKQLDPDSQVAVEVRVTKSILLYLFENYTAEKNPLLDKVFRYPNGKTRMDPIRFVGSTWDGDILPFRESLIRVEKQWDAISNRTSTKCPIHFSPEELRSHYKDGEGWNELQDFWDAVSGITGRDGWTSHETYDQAMSIYSQIMAEASASQKAREE